jgi:hypothetical protein
MGWKNYNLPPGCTDADISGGAEHWKECPAHEDNEPEDDVECECSDLNKAAREEAEEFAFDYARDAKMEERHDG